MAFQSEKKRMKEMRARYRNLFLCLSGQWVLAKILEESCRFFDPPVDEETAIRQTVGKEILGTMGLWPDINKEGETLSFIRKLARFAPEAQISRSRLKEGDKKNG